MKESRAFQEYVTMSKELQRIPIDRASEDEKKAFFINIYNALVIHANVVTGPPSGLFRRIQVSIVINC